METEKSSQLYFRLLGYLKPYSLVFSISIFGMILAAATEVALPVVIKPFLDGTFIDKDPTLMTWTPIALVLIFLVRGVYCPICECVGRKQDGYGSARGDV